VCVCVCVCVSVRMYMCVQEYESVLVSVCKKVGVHSEEITCLRLLGNNFSKLLTSVPRFLT
jgi:hypothetical protein